MRLKNVLIIVTDIDKSKRFYHDIFGLEVVLDNNETVIFTAEKNLAGFFEKRSETKKSCQ